jgi:hypothetical protein
MTTTRVLVNPDILICYDYFYCCRFKAKLRVSDGTDDAIFVLFDTDMQYLLKKECAAILSSTKV